MLNLEASKGFIDDHSNYYKKEAIVGSGILMSIFIFSQVSWIIVAAIIMLKNNQLLKRNAELEIALANELLKPAMYDVFEEFREKRENV